MTKTLLFTLLWSCLSSGLVFSQSSLTAKQEYAAQVREVIAQQSEVAQIPEYPTGFEGLYEYLQSSVKYPRQARRMGKQGTVLVSFIIDKGDGHVREAAIILGVDALLNQEALRVIEAMPNWIPGKQDGSAVDVQLEIPVSFRLTK